MTLTEADRRRIEADLQAFDDLNSDLRMRFEAAREKWDRLLQPLVDAIDDCERLTETDLEMRMTI